MASGSTHISTRWRGEPGEGPLRTPADHVLDRTTNIDQNKAPPLSPAEPPVETDTAATVARELGDLEDRQDIIADAA